MGLRDKWRRLALSSDELERERLSGRLADVDCTAIVSVVPRSSSRVAGEISRIRTVPRSGAPSFEVMIGDGTAELIAVFVGRKKIGGLELGRRVLFEGTPRRERDRLVMLNPAYTLLTH